MGSEKTLTLGDGCLVDHNTMGLVLAGPRTRIGGLLYSGWAGRLAARGVLGPGNGDGGATLQRETYAASAAGAGHGGGRGGGDLWPLAKLHVARQLVMGYLNVWTWFDGVGPSGKHDDRVFASEPLIEGMEMPAAQAPGGVAAAPGQGAGGAAPVASLRGGLELARG